MINEVLCAGEPLADLLENRLREVWCVSHQEVSENEVREELNGGIMAPDIEIDF